MTSCRSDGKQYKIALKSCYKCKCLQIRKAMNAMSTMMITTSVFKLKSRMNSDQGRPTPIFPHDHHSILTIAQAGFLGNNACLSNQA